MLLIRGAKDGYKHYPCKQRNGNTSRRMIYNKPLGEILAAGGARPGRYKPAKINGGWMCERVEG